MDRLFYQHSYLCYKKLGFSGLLSFAASYTGCMVFYHILNTLTVSSAMHVLLQLCQTIVSRPMHQ